MNGIITRGDGVEFAGCEICDNLTPVHWLGLEPVCKYCFDAYPEDFE